MASKHKNEQTVLTQEGYDKLKAELEKREKETREKIANDLEIATEQGDLSENAAYKAALEEKEFNEARITELKAMLTNVEIKSGDNVTKNDTIVHIGDEVEVELEGGKKMKYTIVGQSETDPGSGKISTESPVGKAVYGQNKGDEVEVKLPTKTLKMKIVSIK